ncbi:MAG: hypothetical protein K2K27_02875 [Muribaculaceae bacterium]|nr:hypothetical protein [Muribaculaceae bacterium]
MKNISLIMFSVLMTLTFVFSTMLQFHHHDHSGNIYLYVTCVGEVELCSHHHHHHDCCSDNDSQSESECAMHLDETIVNDDPNISNLIKSADHYLSQVILSEVTLVCTPLNDLDNRELNYTTHFVTEATGFLETVSRRGPPSVT